MIFRHYYKYRCKTSRPTQLTGSRRKNTSISCPGRYNSESGGGLYGNGRAISRVGIYASDVSWYEKHRSRSGMKISAADLASALESVSR